MNGKRILSLVFVVGLVLSISIRPCLAQDRFDGVDEYIEEAMEQWDVPALSIAVVKDGEVVLIRAYGVREVGKETPVNTETVFRLASISKTFAATTVALLVDEGRMKWDDPVKKHIPSFELADPYLTKNTTLRDLLCHRTGLQSADLLIGRGDVSWEDMQHRLEYLRPVAGFRSKWTYNNLMYAVAGETVAKVSGKPWERYVADHLFEPLDMKSTRPTYASVTSKNRALAYRKTSDGNLAEITTKQFIDSVAPAGAVNSNIIDMAKWLEFWLAEGKIGEAQLLETNTVREMLAMHCAIPVTWKGEGNVYAATFYGWGLGWSVLDYRGKKIHTHGGASGAWIGFMPDESIGVVVLTNLETNNLSGMLMYDVFDTYLLGPKQAWDRTKWEKFWLKADEPPVMTGHKARRKAEESRKKGTKPSLGLHRFAGAYRCELYGAIDVLHQKGDLALRIGANPVVPLIHWQDDSFVADTPEADAPWYDWLLRFQVLNGKVQSIEIDRLGDDEPMPRFEPVKDTSKADTQD